MVKRDTVAVCIAVLFILCNINTNTNWSYTNETPAPPAWMSLLFLDIRQILSHPALMKRRTGPEHSRSWDQNTAGAFPLHLKSHELGTVTWKCVDMAKQFPHIARNGFTLLKREYLPKELQQKHFFSVMQQKESLCLQEPTPLVMMQQLSEQLLSSNGVPVILEA